MEDILDHFEAAPGDPKAVVCITCHSKLPKNFILQNHLKTSKHMRALSKFRCHLLKNQSYLLKKELKSFNPKWKI